MKNLKKVLFLLFVFQSIRSMTPDPDRLGTELINTLVAVDFSNDAEKAKAIEKAKELIKNGANVNVEGPVGSNALLWAVRTGNTELVTMIIEQGTELEKSEGMGNYENPLRAAAARGDKEMVVLLLHRGASINTEGPYGQTPLSEAASEGQLDMVKLLLSKNANVRGVAGATALREAVRYKHADIISLLLDKGVDVNSKDMNGETALKLAVWMSYSQDNTEIIKLLVNKGADIHIKDKYGETPLSIAKKRAVKNILLTTSSNLEQILLNLTNILENLNSIIR